MASTGLIQQAAAMPVRLGQVCVVSNRRGKRWVIPKGCLEPGKSAGEVALIEAWEEAGLVGLLQPEPVGSYIYEKAGTICHVLVFLMQVTQICDAWPEQSFRTRNWLTPTQAVARVAEQGLRELLRGVLVTKAG